MRSALIIGAAGQDGRLLAELLLQRGYAVRGWTRSEPATATPCVCEPIDLLNAGAVDDGLGAAAPDEIYYLAAFHHSTEERVRLSDKELLQRSLDVHLVGLQNVLGAIKTHSPAARLFYAASSHIFGQPTDDLQDEQTPFVPNSAYGISKAAGIRCCRFYREQEGLFAATGILFNHESILRKASFLSQKIVRGAWEARRDPACRVTLADLDATADWGYAPDYVEAMWRILQLPAASDFVVASGEVHTVREFAQAAFGALGLDWREHVQSEPRLDGQARFSLRGNARKLRAATGWSPSVSFPELVTRLVHEAGASFQTGATS